MDVKLKTLSVGVLFFIGGQTLLAQKTKVDTIKKKDIEEVVLVGYAKRKVTNTTGGSQKIGSEKVSNTTQTNIEGALQGQVAGVQVGASSGTPGATQDVRVRGVGSFTAGTTPLYVIDGVPVVTGDFSSSTETSSISPLASIPAEDIENITVLKDAGSTAAYGARGANGIILITTKRGKSGKAKFSLSANYGFQNEAFDKYKGLTGTQKFELLKESLINAKISGQLKKDGPKVLITSSNVLDYIKYNNPAGANDWLEAGGLNYEDWKTALQKRNAPTREYNFSAAGGNQGVRYYFSLNYNQTEGTGVGMGFDRVAATAKVDANLNSKAKLQTSITLSKVNQSPISEQSAYFSNPYLMRYMMNPWFNPKNEDGTPNKDTGAYTSLYNPAYLAEHNIFNNRFLRAFGNARFEYKLTKNLTFANNFGIDYSLLDAIQYFNREHGDGAQVLGKTQKDNNQDVNFVNQVSLNWVQTLGKDHRFDVLALYEYQKEQEYSLQGRGEKIPFGLHNLANASTGFNAYSAYNDSKQISFLGMLNYTFRDRLVLDGTFRREGSSKFASGHRFGNFWSVGLAYNLHKDINPNGEGLVNELKLRGSYGITGNSGIGSHEYLSVLNYNAVYNGEYASYPSSYGNNDLTWEKNRTYDVGVNFALLDRRISGEISYFDKLTYDLLQEVDLSRTTGFNKIRRNVGEMDNRGVEVSLSVDVVRNDFFKWNLYGSISTLSNKVVSLAKNEAGIDIDIYSDSKTRGAEVGTSFAHWRMRKFAGVDPQTGSPLWYINGVDGEVTSDYSKANVANQGTSIPKYQGGFGTKIELGSFFINALVSFQGGHKIYDGTAQFVDRTNSFTVTSFNGSEELMNRWQKPGDVTDIPKLVYSGKSDNFHLESTRWLHDGTFARLRSLQVGYNLKKYEYLKEIGVSGITIQLTGTNLFTWVKDKTLKLDPETGSSSVVSFNAPPVKTVLAGVTINF